MERARKHSELSAGAQVKLTQYEARERYADNRLTRAARVQKNDMCVPNQAALALRAKAIRLRRASMTIGSRKLLFEMISKAQRQGNDCQGRVVRAPGWEHRAACNVKVCQRVHAAIFIDDA